MNSIKLFLPDQTKKLTLVTALAVFIILLASLPGVNAGSPLAWSTTLDNGAQVIIIEDHSSPLVASVVNIRAGSHTETIPINGISHLLEHLLFDGTTNLTAAELQSSVEARGGYINAFTRKDYVSFEVVMPVDEYRYGLKVQADQLLNSTIPETELVRERKVVCEEIATDLKSSSSAADAALWESLFGSSGYGLPIIGNYQTVTEVHREDIINFYRSRYVPNRMTIVVIGDVKPQEVLDEIKTLYQDAKPGLDSPGSGELPVFPREGKTRVLGKDVKNQTMSMALPGPSPDDPAFLLFNMAVDLWANSTNSPLSEAMKPFASRVGAYVTTHRGFSLLQVTAMPDSTENPEQLLDQMVAAVMSSIELFLSQPVTTEMLEPLIKSARVDHEFAREKFHHLAREIGERAALGNLQQYWNFQQELDRVAPDAVSAAFGMWIAECKPVAVLVVPDPDASKTVTNYEKPVIKVLPNGLTVITQYDSYADMVALHLLTANPGSDLAGVPRVVAEMLDSGTEKMTAEQLQQALKQSGIRTKLADWAWLPFDDYYDSTEYNYFRMECLSGDLSQAIQLMSQMAFSSVLPDTAWENSSRTMRMMAGRNMKSASARSKQGLRQAMFQNAYFQQGRLPGMRDISGINPELLRTYYQETYVPGNCILSVVGNVLPDQLMAEVEASFGKIEPGNPTAAPTPILNSPSRQFTQVDDSMAYIRAAIPITTSQDNIAAWAIAAEVLSNALQDEIRAKRGKAYRLGAWLNEMKGVSFIEIGVGTRDENLAEIEQVVREIVDSIPELNPADQMIQDTANSLVGHELRFRQRRINRAYYLGWRHWQGLGIEFETGYIDRLKKVESESVTKLLRNMEKSDQWFWSVAASEDVAQ